VAGIFIVVEACSSSKNFTIMKEYLNLLQQLDQFIRRKKTGSPPEFARKMGISERSLYEYLKVLKELGAPIRFSRLEHSYYYEVEGQFYVSFF
jgi:predicted DNA-binding transcriptional regulator YafY